VMVRPAPPEKPETGQHGDPHPSSPLLMSTIRRGHVMDRRDFIKSGAIGAAALTVGGLAPWLSPEGAFAASKMHRENGKPWKFGVMADTQWSKNADGQNPGTCAVGIINLVNAEFIAHGVKFVIQVGDLIDSETDSPNGNAGMRTMPVRAAAAQKLYDNGIGFFPLRGNHEGSLIGANELDKLYPQTRGFGPNVHGASNFSSPFASLDGCSYSFDFHNIRFVMLDQFVRADGTGFGNIATTVVDKNIIDQQPWIDSSLAGRAKNSHAFVLAHKNLIGQNHVDCLFGANPSTNPVERDAFITSLAKNGVRYTLGGHDHMHHRSVIKTADGSASVKEIICASDSYKFYYPGKPSNDNTYDVPARETTIAQELDTIGFYIFTVDGPRITVDFYSSTIGMPYGAPVGNESKLVNSPTSTRFYRRERFGYSLNGKEFVVAQGASLTPVMDSFHGTVARILGGTNGATAVDASGRPLSKAIDTGWSYPRKNDDSLASHVLTLWGLADNLALWDESLGATLGMLPNADRTEKGDTYALSISYDDLAAHGQHFNNGKFGVATRDANGHWVKAVSKNFGGTTNFVLGPWNSSYGLGTYGVDTHTKTAWAVVNYDGDFAVAKGL